MIDLQKKQLLCWALALSVFSLGTGVVTSVPSDAPDDIAALRDIKKKEVRLQTFKQLLLKLHPGPFIRQVKSAAEKHRKQNLYERNLEIK